MGEGLRTKPRGNRLNVMAQEGSQAGHDSRLKQGRDVYQSKTAGVAVSQREELVVDSEDLLDDEEEEDEEDYGCEEHAALIEES